MSWFMTHRQTLRLYVGVLLAFLFFSPATVPQAQAACANAALNIGAVAWLASCTEYKDTNGGASAAPHLPLPSGTVAGDILIMTIVADGDRNYGTTLNVEGLPPAILTQAWTSINVGQNAGNNVWTGVYGMIVPAGTLPTEVQLNIGGANSGDDYIATMMRFTGVSAFASGTTGTTNEINFAIGTGWTGGTAAPAPAIRTAVRESLVLRIGGFDDDDMTLDAAAFAAPHVSFSMDDTGNGANGVVSFAAAILPVVAANTDVAAANFTNIPNTDNEEYRTVSLALRPKVEQCTSSNAVPSLGPVGYEGCEQTHVYGAATSAITLRTPTGAAAGDYLVAVVAVDGNYASGAWDAVANGWTEIDVGATDGTAATLAIYGRLLTAAPPASYTLDWGATAEEAFGYIMRFTGASGVVDESWAATTGSGLAAATPTPDITTFIDNSLVVRMGGYDNNSLTMSPSTIMTGWNNVTQSLSSGATVAAAVSASGAAAWLNKATAGLDSAVAFTSTPTISDNTRRMAIALRPRQLCTGTGGIASGAIVEYSGCEQRTANNATQIIVPTPSATAAGDYLLAVVATDGNATASIAPPAGWTDLHEGVSLANGATLAIYGRFAPVPGAQDHTFTWTTARDAFAYIMRFEKVGSFDEVVTSAPASGTNVSVPALATDVTNEMIVRIGAFEGNQVALSPAVGGIINTPAHNNITQGRSSQNDSIAVSSAAAWRIQASGTAIAAPFVAAPSPLARNSRTATLGLRPMTTTFFKVGLSSPNGTICSPTTVTITAANADFTNQGASYTGTVSLTTSNTNGYWSKTTVGTDAQGTLIPGSGNGTATYQFVAGDAGDVTLLFQPTTAGVITFGVQDGARVQHPGQPTLTVTNCTSPSWIRQVCETDGSIDIAITASNANRSRAVIVTTHRSGNVGAGSITSTQTFNATLALTQIGTTRFAENGTADAVTQMYMISDTTSPALPAGAGTYTVAVTNNIANYETRTCAFYLENISTTVPSGGAIGGQGVVSVTNTITTSVTPAANNSFVLSAATGRGTTTYTTPVAPLTDRFYNDGTGTTATGVSSLSGAANGVALNLTESTFASTSARAHAVAAFGPAASRLNHFRITHGGSGATCAPNAVTITAYDQYGATFNYSGTLVLETTTTGTWSASGGGPTPTNTGNGDATVAVTGGTVTVNFNYATAGSVDINAKDQTLQGVTERAQFDPALVIGNCKFRFTHVASNNMCSQTAVTLSVHLPSGALAQNYAGTVTLSTDIVPGAGGTIGQGGTWTSIGDNLGALNDTGNGNATIAITDNDDGNVILNFQRGPAGTIDFNASAGSDTEDLTNDTTLDLTSCFFHIEYGMGGAFGDVCTPEPVIFSVVDDIGDPVTGYAGKLEISTGTAKGDWSDPAASVKFDNDGLGVASYDFDGTEGGTITLELRHPSVASVDIDAADDMGFAEDSPTYDAPLDVDACTFRIDIDPPTSTTCTTTTVTVGVYDRTNQPAMDFTGQVTLSTSTSNGSWLTETGAGSLALGNEVNGTDTYNFVNEEEVDIVFTHAVVGTIDFNVESVADPAAILVDATTDPENNIDYDPALKVTACLPIVHQVQCYASNSALAMGPNPITLPSLAETQGSRMVLMYVNSATNDDIDGATIDGEDMDFIRQESSAGTILDVYGLADTDLPEDAGPVDVGFTGGDAGAAMCVVVFEGVAQALPSGLQVNSTTRNDGAAISTSITTVENNSLVLSVVATPQPLAALTYTNANSNAIELWNAGAVDATGADWASFRTFQLEEGPVTVINDPTPNPADQVQIVLALAPKVTGDAARVGYAPVTLFSSLSGNVSYRAGGNTLREHDNVDGACDMLEAPNNYSDAEINLPDGSEVLAAYLYWAGSGWEFDQSDPDDIHSLTDDVDFEVTFGRVGGPFQTVNAQNDTDEPVREWYFIIDPDQVYNPDFPAVAAGFFAAAADVTTIVKNAVIANGVDNSWRVQNLDVQTGEPWFSSKSCVGGWSLVIVYENLNENFNVINLFHGFQPFYHSSFRLVPRNFRMATRDGVSIPNGQITHVTFEGDADPVALTGVTEVFELQNTPGVMNFDKLISPPMDTQYNPADNQYNSTVTSPNYTGHTFDGDYSGDTTSWGTDIDTYYIQGDSSGELLYPFAAPGTEAEQITTEYSTGQDIVLLVGEFISVTNSPIADLEVTVTDTGPFKVNTSGESSYVFEVNNNGNGAISGGYADGDVILTGNLPPNVEINTINASTWDCPVNKRTATAFTCIFEINGDANANASVPNELHDGESLPLVTVTVNVGSEDVFPALTTPVYAYGRIAHVGDYYTAVCRDQNMAAGVQPNPNPSGGCSRSPQFDNKNDLNKYLKDIDNIFIKDVATQNNVDRNVRDVNGLATDLQLTKTLLGGVLQEGDTATYSLSVKNNGTDATTKPITVNDTLPAGVEPTAVIGTGWSCLPIAGQVVECTHAGALGTTSPTHTAQPLLITVDVTGDEGDEVENEASVVPGAGNNDTTNTTNNLGKFKTNISGPVPPAAEKFLISVTNNNTDVGDPPGPTGPLTVDRDDLVMYDPQTQTATMFLAEASIPDIGVNTNLSNVGALHVMRNGHIVIGTKADGAVIAGVTFNEEDLVLYDPVLKTARLIFDGSKIFAGTDGFDVNTETVDAVFVRDNGSDLIKDWTILLSTTNNATIGALTFNQNDIVSYAMGDDGFGEGGTATLLVNGGSADMFGSNMGDIDGLYVRWDDPNKYVLATSDASATIGSGIEQITFEEGEVVEIDLTTPGSPVTTPLLCDSVGDCQLSPPLLLDHATADPRIDALHMVETGYFGHFSIESIGGDACHATAITIRKHAGLDHDLEDDYYGSIRISNSTGMGSWSKDVTAQGEIINDGDPLDEDPDLNLNLGVGEAIYTFSLADEGEVILYLEDIDTTNTLNVDITNSMGVEDPATEDDNITISDFVVDVDYGDGFGAAVYNNNEPDHASFASNWIESGDDGSPTTGNIRVAVDPNNSSGKLRLNNSNNMLPSVTRSVDFSSYEIELAPTLAFRYRIAGSPSGSVIVEARDLGQGPGWVELDNFTASIGGPTLVSYTLTTELGIGLDDFTEVEFRFRIASGYNGGNDDQFFYVDDVLVSTKTHNCGAGDSLDHYMISAGDGSMVSCLAKEVTVTPHNLTDSIVAPGAGVILTLNTDTNRGTWGRPTNGSGNFTAIPGTGQATYEYVAGEQDLKFPFYYTELVTDPEQVTFEVSDNDSPGHDNKMDETATLNASRAGFRFYNETLPASETFPTLVAGMPSNYRGKVLTLQAVRVSPVDPTLCEAAFPDNSDVTVKIGVECKNPSDCSADPRPLVLTNNGTSTEIFPVMDDSSSNPLDEADETEITLRFNNDNLGAGASSFSRAQLILNYMDVGEIQLHARRMLQESGPTGNTAPNQLIASGEYMTGISSPFVVRPFALDIDFVLDPDGGGGDDPYPDRGKNGHGDAAASFANDAGDEVFHTAGVGFNTTVRAVLWECLDDDPGASNCASPTGGTFDGVPNANVDLSYYDEDMPPGNATAPNFGNETPVMGNNLADNVTITRFLGSAMTGGSTLGILTDETFQAFVDGEQTHTMTYSEVGTVDFKADLDQAYLGSEGVTGRVNSVGRFKPDHFIVTPITLIDRPLVSPSSAPFTYMGEQFTTTFKLTARNALNGITENYEGDFAKLTNAATELTFYAIDDITIGNDVNYSTRLERPASPTPFSFSSPWSDGEATLTGNLIFNRQTSGAAEIPIIDLQIALRAADADDVEDDGRTVEDDTGSPDVAQGAGSGPTGLYSLVGLQSFRYGRIRLENAYGSDILDTYDQLYDHDDNVLTAEIPRGGEALVRLVAEYFDANGEFIPNGDDSATAYNSDELTFVPSSYTDLLGAGEATVVAGIKGKFYSGLTRDSASQNDKVLYLRAPGINPDQSTNEGTALIELDLVDLGLGFLRYDWRDANPDPLLAEDNTDGVYTDNPRSMVEFGTFRGNDRIINWQEIFE
jgi:hypothetical protein